MTIEQQFITLGMMIGSSFVLGTFFDGYRVLRGKIFLHWIITFFIDLFYGIIAAFLTFYLLLWSNNGQLRLVVFFFFIIGLVLYYLLLSKHFVKAWLSFFQFVYYTWKIITKSFNLLFIKPIQFVYKVILIILGFLLSIILTIFSFIKKIFSFLFGGIYKFTSNKTTKSKEKIKSKLRKKRGIFLRLKKLFKRK